MEPVSNFDLALSVALGIGLAAATGFRIFLPMLVTSIAANTGHLPLAESFAWLGTPAALIVLGVAGLMQSMTALLRAKSTVFTGGLGNPVIATTELGSSLLVSLLSLAAPFAALLLVMLFLWLALRFLLRLTRRDSKPLKQ